ncbi:MAG TPA: hypothetical protein DCL81_06020 [Algoriphagus sp.]|nr:hypothetical protein [Algoriphagus sp.]HCX74245.1 hypothetical protein [Algoriphagus sp.]
MIRIFIKGISTPELNLPFNYKFLKLFRLSFFYQIILSRLVEITDFESDKSTFEVYFSGFLSIFPRR